MAQVKLPQITVALNATYDKVYKENGEEFQWTQVNPSCLLAYLGIRGFANLSGVTTKTATKNAVPILAYYDIFKNFYANTQEDNFYIIGATLQLNKISRVTPAGNEASIPLQSTYIMEEGTSNDETDCASNGTQRRRKRPFGPKRRRGIRYADYERTLEEEDAFQEEIME